MLSGKLFHNCIILLEKLNLRTCISYEYVTAAMQIYDFLRHTVFFTFTRYPFNYLTVIIYPQRFYRAQSYLLLSSRILK